MGISHLRPTKYFHFPQISFRGRKVPILAPDTKFKPMFGSEAVCGGNDEVVDMIGCLCSLAGRGNHSCQQLQSYLEVCKLSKLCLTLIQIITHASFALLEIQYLVKCWLGGTLEVAGVWPWMLVC